MKILILLASFNGEKFIRQQIDSILNQKKVEIDLLVSDDDSTDQTRDILNFYSHKFKNIQYITNKIKTSNHSGNFYNLIIESNVDDYDYIGYADQDDIFNDHKYFISTQHLRSTDSKGLSTSVKCFEGSNKNLNQVCKNLEYDFFFEGAGQGCTFVLEKNIFNEFKAFIKKNIKIVIYFYYHDWLTYIYYRATNKKWLFIDNTLTHYRIHSNNNTGNRATLNGIIFRFFKVFSPWYLKQVFLASLLANKINNKIPKLSSLSLIKTIYIVSFKSRRKITDRFLLTFFFFYYVISFIYVITKIKFKNEFKSR